MNHKVRKITEGAMMVALYGLVLFINRQLAGLFEIYFMFILPLPLVVYSVKFGFRSSLVVCASIFFLSIMIATPQTYFYILTSMFVGITYGSMVRKKVNNGMLVSLTILISILSSIITTLIFASFFGYDLINEMASMHELIGNVMGYVGMQEASLGFDLGLIIFVAVIAATILTGLMEGILVHMFSNIILKRLKFEVHSFKPLSSWVVPKWTGVLAFVGFSSSLLLKYVKMEAAGQIMVTSVVIVCMIYLVVFGFIACVLYGMVEYKKNIGVTVVLVGLLLFPIAMPVLAFIGFLYISTDLREMVLLRRNPK